MADLLHVGQMLPSPGVYGLLFPGGLPEMPCFRQAPTTPSAESGTVPWLAEGHCLVLQPLRIRVDHGMGRCLR